MSYLVDTNVFSEPAKPKPEQRVVEWLREHEPDIYVSSITIGEIRRGIEGLSKGKRQNQLRDWLSNLCDCMHGRVLTFNTATAHVWGQLKAKWDREGIVIPSLDSQITASAHRHGLIIVTRDVKHFERTGVKVLNPFVQ